MEKYRYRHKTDELRDKENRQKELRLDTNSDWVPGEHSGRMNPLEYMDSLPTRHKNRLIRQDKRESTPER